MKKKNIFIFCISVMLLLVTSCARKQKESSDASAGNAAATATTEEIVLEEVSIPKADALINKVLNPPAGRGEVEVFDGTFTYRETKADFFLQGEDWENTAACAAFEKGETATHVNGELVIRMKPRNAETDADGNAAESEERKHAIQAYLVKTSASEGGTEKESTSRYELFLYDDTDDTWELETFKTKDVTTARMMIKNMIKDREVYYVAPGETDGRELSETEKTLSVNPEDPGTFQLRGVIDVSELASLLDGYGTGTAIGDAKDTVKEKASEAAQKAEEIAGEAAQKATEALQGTPEDNVVFLGDAAKEFLEGQGHDLQRILEEHGDELQQYYEENKDKIKEKLDESGIREQIENFDVQDIIDSGQQAVQTVQDYFILRELLLSVQEAPLLTATFNAYTGELKRVEVYLKSSENEESNAHLNRFTAIIRYNDHTAPSVTVPEEVTETAEDKEHGMIFHRVIEEMELYRKNR